MVNKMEKEVYQGSIDSMVKIIDWTPINKAISKAVGQDVECRLGKGFFPKVNAIFDKKLQSEEVRSIIIDDECCGTTTKTKNMYISDINEDVFTASLFRGIGFYKVSEDEDGKKAMYIYPSFYFDIDEDDIKKCLTGEEIPLYLFMKSRYGYNPRIVSNEWETLRLLFNDDKGDEWKTKVNKSWEVA
jgi:hypothetical protein